MQGWTIGMKKVRSGTIGTTAAQITATEIPLDQGVVIKALAANSGTVFVGTDSGVTNGTAGTLTDGYPLAAGEELPVHINDLSKIYLIGSAASQGYACLYG